MTVKVKIKPDGQGRSGVLAINGQELKLPGIIISPRSLNLLTVQEVVEAGMIPAVNTFAVWQAHQDLGGKRARSGSALPAVGQWHHQGLVMATDPMSSAAALAKSRGIKSDIVRFRTAPKGPLQSLSPAESLKLQQDLGADIVVLPTQRPDYFAPKDLIDAAAKRTADWTGQALAESNDRLNVLAWQGAGLKRSRLAALSDLKTLGPLPALAVDGVFQDEPFSESQRLLTELTAILDTAEPQALRLTVNRTGQRGLELALQSGIDLVTTALPTDLAEKGLVLAGSESRPVGDWQGSTRPLAANCPCPVCQQYAAGELAEMVKLNQVVGRHLLAVHNLYALGQLVSQANFRTNLGD